LQELLQEIAEEQMKSDAGNVHDEDKSDEHGIVLVTCKDERTCLQLQECILKGPCQVIVRVLNEVSINLYSTTLLL
jgi:DNA excision repair protein ERCC-4